MTALQLKNLTKSYGTRQVLHDVSYQVDAGEIFGFVGGNGAGKTTTMRIVLGVLASDSGQVLWDDRPISLDDRRRIGYMPEERGLYPKMHVKDQLEYLAKLHGLSAAAARRETLTWAERLGVAERLGDEVQKLSLGNQQRVQLAAALVYSPEILVLDEPFSGLDPIAVDVMSGVLNETAAQGVPVIFSSHQLELVERLCHRVGIIKNGAMVAVGAIDDLRQTEHPRFTITGPTSSEALIAAIPGAAEINRDGATAVIEVPGGDGQALLRAALAIGPVTEFGPTRVSLTDMYRHVVAEEAAK